MRLICYRCVGNLLATNILLTEEAVVQAVYFLIATILANSGFVAEISLLGFMYLLVAFCLQEPGAKAASKTTFKLTSLLIISILSAIFAAILALQIKIQVDISYDISISDDPLTIVKLQLAYYALLICASIEVLALTIRIFLRARKRGFPTVVDTPILQHSTRLYTNNSSRLPPY